MVLSVELYCSFCNNADHISPGNQLSVSTSAEMSFRWFIKQLPFLERICTSSSATVSSLSSMLLMAAAAFIEIAHI